MTKDVRKPIPDGITRAHILKAIEEIDAGHMHGFGKSIDYDLKHEGRRYPPKAAVGIAAMYAAGEVMGPEQFTSGTGSKCFKILEEQGFSVVKKSHPIQSEADLNGIHLEHYLVAKSLTGSFSRADFIARYRKLYPARNEGSYLVSDYAYNNEQKAKDQFPSFLERLGRATYQFVGLDLGGRKKARNPDWTRDEIMLALEFYLMNRDKIPGKESTEIAQLSTEIRQLAAVLGLEGDERFRNPNGVYMKIMNIRSHDPAYTSQGKVGLSSANRLEEEVWERFGGDLQSLKLATANIRQQLTGSIVDTESTEYDEPEIAEAPEGRIITRLHRVRERSRKLVERKKASFRRAHGSLYCEACGFDFSKVYGPRGVGYIECHHTKPVHEMKLNETTRLSDLTLVCANCHRMIHAKRPWLTIHQLRRLLRD